MIKPGAQPVATCRRFLLIGAVSVMAGCSAFRPLVDDGQPSAAAAANAAKPRVAQEAPRDSADSKVALGRVNGKTLYSSDLDRSLSQEIERSKSEALQREMHLRWVGF